MTAELAVGVTSVSLLLVVVVAVAAAVTARIELVGAAGVGARLAARAESPDVIADAVRATGGPGTECAVTARGGFTHVEAFRDIALPLIGRVRLRAAASAVSELSPPATGVAGRRADPAAAGDGPMRWLVAGSGR